MPQEPLCSVKWYSPVNIDASGRNETVGDSTGAPPPEQPRPPQMDVKCPSPMFLKVAANAELKSRLRRIGVNGGSGRSSGTPAPAQGTASAEQQQTAGSTENGGRAPEKKSAPPASKTDMVTQQWSNRGGDFQLWIAFSTLNITPNAHRTPTGKEDPPHSQKDIEGRSIIGRATGQLILEPLISEDGVAKTHPTQKLNSSRNSVRSSSERPSEGLDVSRQSSSTTAQGSGPKLVCLQPIHATFLISDENLPTSLEDASQKPQSSDELEVQSSADSLETEGAHADNRESEWNRGIRFLLQQLTSTGSKVLQPSTDSQGMDSGNTYLVGPSGYCCTMEAALKVQPQEDTSGAESDEKDNQESKPKGEEEEEKRNDQDQGFRTAVTVDILLKPLCRRLPDHIINDQQIIRDTCKPPPVSFPSNVLHAAYCCSNSGDAILQYGGSLIMNADETAGPAGGNPRPSHVSPASQQSQNCQRDEHFSRRLYKLTPANGRMVVLPNRSLMMPPGLAHHSMVFAGEKEVLVFGGFLDGLLTNRCTDHMGPIVAVNDNITDSERQRRGSSIGETNSSSPSSSATSGNAAAVSFWKPTTLYPNPPESASLSSSHHHLIGNGVYSYAVDEGRWTHIKCLGEVPTARYGHSATVAGEYMIVAGGQGETAASTALIQQQLYLLHTKSFVWVRLETAPLVNRMLVGSGSTTKEIGISAIIPLTKAVVALGSEDWSVLTTKDKADQPPNQDPKEEPAQSTTASNNQQPQPEGQERQQITTGWWRIPIAVCDRAQMGKEIHVRKTFLLQAVSNAPSSENPAAALTGVVLRSKDDINTTVARLTYEDTLPLSMQDPRRLRVISMRKEQSKRPDTFATRGASPQEREVACQELIERLFDPKYASRRESKHLKIIEEKEASRHEEFLRQKGRSTDIAVDHEAFVHKFYTMELEKKRNKESKRLAKLKERPYQSSKQQQAAVDVSGLVDRLFDNRAAKARQTQLLQKYTTPPPGANTSAEGRGDTPTAVKGSDIVNRLLTSDQRHLERQKALYEKYVERPRSRSPKKKGSKPASPTSAKPTDGA